MRPESPVTRTMGRAIRRVSWLALVQRAVGDLDGLLLDVEAERLLGLDVAARHAEEEGVVAELDGVDVADREHGGVAGRYDEVASVPMLTHESPLHPSGIYGASKVWGEALGRHYADAHGLSVICVRIGRVTREDRPQSPREFAVWCSQRDIARFLERCIAAPPSIRFDTFFATSNNRWGYRDLTHARDVLGWEPLDRAEDQRELLSGPRLGAA